MADELEQVKQNYADAVRAHEQARARVRRGMALPNPPGMPAYSHQDSELTTSDQQVLHWLEVYRLRGGNIEDLLNVENRVADEPGTTNVQPGW